MHPPQTEKCYRVACSKPHDNCRHTMDGWLYCEDCAVLINRGNPEYRGLVRIPRLEAFMSQVGTNE